MDLFASSVAKGLTSIDGEPETAGSLLQGLPGLWTEFQASLVSLMNPISKCKPQKLVRILFCGRNLLMGMGPRSGPQYHSREKDCVHTQQFGLNVCPDL